MRRTFAGGSGGGAGSFAPLAGDARFLSSTRFVLTSGAATVSVVGGGSRFPAWQLDAAASEQVTAVYDIPIGWLTYTAELYWSNSGAGAGDVYWQITRSARADADDLSAGDVTTNIGAVTAPALNILKVTTAEATITADHTKPLKHMRVVRVAANVADTLANDCAFIGLMLRRLT